MLFEAAPMLAPYYGSGSGETCTSTEAPLPTVTTKARHSLVMPVTHGADPGRVRDPETDPLPTITAAPRGELAFIAAAFGERPTQAPRVHSIEEPTPTICAEGRIPLVQADAQRFDILFRMLEPHELAAAMSFDDGDFKYEFAGNKTQKTKQIGNAVPVRTAAALVGAIMEE
jgi:DNA (cytosine-5)-methyltransferase 1